MQSQTDTTMAYQGIAGADANAENGIYTNITEIPVDSYTVSIYHLDLDQGSNSLCASTEWTSEVTDETDNVHITYDLDTNEIVVESIDPPYESHYEAVVTSVATAEDVDFSDLEKELGNSDFYSTEVEGLTAGDYKIAIYELGEELVSGIYTIDDTSGDIIYIRFRNGNNHMDVINAAGTISQFDGIVEVTEKDITLDETNADTVETTDGTGVTVTTTTETKDSSDIGGDTTNSVSADTVVIEPAEKEVNNTNTIISIVVIIGIVIAGICCYVYQTRPGHTETTDTTDKKETEPSDKELDNNKQ
jgi:hypothetical protein